MATLNRQDVNLTPRQNTQSSRDRFNGSDFPEGFIIEEVSSRLPLGETPLVIALKGDQLPYKPFSVLGSQRAVKTYYAGNPEPTLQVMGPKEENISLRGVFKDRFFSAESEQLYPSEELSRFIDNIRIRGNLCKFSLGEWVRYGVIVNFNTDTRRRNRIAYQIDLLIIGRTLPTTGKVVQESQDFLNEINLSAISQIAFENNEVDDLLRRLDSYRLLLGLPEDDSVFATEEQVNQTNFLNNNFLIEQTRALKEFTDTMASSIAVARDVVNEIISQGEELKREAERAIGTVQTAINDTFRTIEFFANFRYTLLPNNLDIRHNSILIYSRIHNRTKRIRQDLEEQLSLIRQILQQEPLRIYRPVQGDTLQSISNLFYGTPEQWREIYDQNELDSTDLSGIEELEIPRL